MTQKVFPIKIRIYLDELLGYYKEDPSYGSKSKPIPVESFYELISPCAKFTGPLRNILILEDDCKYSWSLVDANDKPLNIVGDESDMDLQMITNSPSDAKWDKVFKNIPKMDKDGKIKIKGKSTKRSEFELDTNINTENGGVIKYSFIFEFTDALGGIKYGIVDPMAGTYPPPTFP
jgi:hypothetical protein